MRRSNTTLKQQPTKRDKTSLHSSGTWYNLRRTMGRRRGGKRRRERKKHAAQLVGSAEGTTGHNKGVYRDGGEASMETLNDEKRHHNEERKNKKMKLTTTNDDDGGTDNNGDNRRVSIKFCDHCKEGECIAGRHSLPETIPKTLSTTIPGPIENLDDIDEHDNDNDIEGQNLMKILRSTFLSISSAGQKPHSDSANDSVTIGSSSTVSSSSSSSSLRSTWQPTLIQRHVWPILLKTSHSLISISPTGSGKTLSYAIPSVVHQLTINEGGTLSCNDEGSVLVLVPTRELVHQVASVYAKVLNGIRRAYDPSSKEKGTRTKDSSNSSSRTTVIPIHGGVSREGQRRALEQARNMQRRRRQQQEQFNEPLVLVATPGRLLDFLNEQQQQEQDNSTKTHDSGRPRSLIPSNISWIILDEADQLTKEGDLGPQVDQILSLVKSSSSSVTKSTIESSRMVLVSATYPEKCRSKFCEWIGPKYIQVTVDGMMKKDSYVSQKKFESSTQNLEGRNDVESDNTNEECQKSSSASLSNLSSPGHKTPKSDSLTAIPTHLEQILHVCSEHKKPRKLINFLKQQMTQDRQSQTQSKGIIFFSKIDKLKQSERLLQKEGIRCVPLHGQLSVEQRQKNLKFFTDFGDRQLKGDKVDGHGTVVLLATDLAARGVDVPRINFVVQYDFPSNLEQYAHRCGRAGRSATTNERCSNQNDGALSKPEKYTVYSFFTRNLAALARDMVQLLERSNAWVDPNLRQLIPSPKKYDGAAKQSKTNKRKANGVEKSDEKHKKAKSKAEKISSKILEDDDQGDDDEDEGFLSGNRIVLKRASHVSDASSSDDDDDGDD